MSISYDEDIDRVKTVLDEVAASCEQLLGPGMYGVLSITLIPVQFPWFRVFWVEARSIGRRQMGDSGAY